MSSGEGSKRFVGSFKLEGLPSLKSYLPEVPKLEEHLPKLEKFPSLMELVDKPEPSARSSRSRGLFEDLLQSRPEVLLQDAHQHPGAYDEDVVALLERMVENRGVINELEPADAEKLNRATAEFFSASPSTKSAPRPESKRVAIKPVDSPEEKPMDIPSDNPFWWT